MVNNEGVVMSEMGGGVAFESNDRLREFVCSIIPAESIVNMENWFLGRCGGCLS